jgi:photosystem II stability/assembly factor-like uncharacterized protein
VKKFGFPIVMGLLLVVSACTAPAASSPQSAESTQTPAPYSPDTPSPPTIDAPVVESPSLVSIQFVSSLNGWGVTATQIVRTTDGGFTWYNVTPPEITEAGYKVTYHALDQDHAWVHMPDYDKYPNSGTLYQTADGGLTWKSISSPFSEGEIQFLDVNNGWVLADLGVGAGSNAVAVYQTTDGGTTWSQKYINDPNAANAGESLPVGGLKSGIAPVDMQTAFVYGVIYKSGTVYLYRTDDGGENWSDVTLPLPVGTENFDLGIDAGQMKFVTLNDGFIVVRLTGDTPQAAVYVTHDGGDNWELIQSPIPDGGSADFVSAQETVIYNGSQFYVTRDAAHTWSVIPPDVNFGDTFAMMDFVDAMTGWVITLDPTTSDPTLYRTTDGGKTWFPLIP